MLTALLFSPDATYAEGIEHLAIESRQVAIRKLVTQYPSPYDVVRLMNSCDPELVLLDLSDWEQASACATIIRASFRKAAILGIGDWQERTRLELASAGVHGVLTSPVTLDSFQQDVERVFRAARGGVRENLCAFLPAKAGNGCSITALNVAGRLAALGDRKTLLLEGDLVSGVLSVRLRFVVTHTLQDVLEDPTRLNRSQWDLLTVKRGRLEILPAGAPRPGPAPKWSNYYHLLEYVLPEYEWVIADLPEAIDAGSKEIVLRARAVFVVGTPEAPSLELARRRCQELIRHGVDPLRVSLVLNRWHETDTSPEDLEQAVGQRVYAVLPNEFAAVRDATGAGVLVDDGTHLGRAFAVLSRKVAGLPPEPEPPPEPKKSGFRLAALIGR